jgi:hypothetical protein
METAQEEEMTTEIVPQQEVRPATMTKLTAAEIRADVNLIQQVLKSVFIEGVHYGVVPGCGDKPALLKPGAEKIMTTFRLNGKPVIEDLSGPDEIRYRVSIRMTHQTTGTEVGWGVGECSSNETKYKWVAPVCNEEFDETPEDRRREKWFKGYKDGKPYKKKQIRPNLQDIANTVLKMAKKRALVDATLTCTAASDVFSQDIEDLPPEIAQQVAAAEAAAARPPMPQRKSEKEQPAPAAPAPAPANVDTKTGEVDDEANDSVEDPPPPQRVAPKRKTLDKTSARKMKAKFTAPCKFCSVKVNEGEDMVYIAEGPDKGGYHVACAEG